MEVPKIIWTFWHDINTLPSIVKYCIQGWKRHNPDYQIIILTENNFNNYINIPDRIKNNLNFKDHIQKFSDLIRCYVLAEYGGIWSDASIIMNEPLENWLLPMHNEFSGFYLEAFTTDDRYPVVESWFFACTKESQFMKMWRDEFSKIADYENVDKYIESRLEMIDRQKIDNLSYLAIHVAAQKVLQYDNYPLEKITLRKAEEGPYLYLVDAEWNSEKAIDILNIKNARLIINNKKYDKTIIKLRGYERYLINSKIK